MLPLMNPPMTHAESARMLLDEALQDLAIVDELPYEDANSYTGRRAKTRARGALTASVTHALLAVHDELARIGLAR